jgi:hypothetical protein
LIRFKKLWLNDTRITDAAVPRLARLDALEDLYIVRTDMTISCVRELKRLRPGCLSYERGPARSTNLTRNTGV